MSEFLMLENDWRALFPDQMAVGEELLARWSEEHRHYHNVDHLALMLSVVDDHANSADDADAVRLAAWFHDIVYDPTRTDNEIASAEYAATTLGGLNVEPARLAEIVRLIWLTTNHNVESGDRNGALLCDADLAILASTPAAYAAYAGAVREEYRHVHDDAFRAGRIAVLTGLLDLEQLYHLPALHEAWEERARDNIAVEIRALRSSDVEDQL
jgi:predicted metal-dependent HD superfamily phosphohydrolase